MPERMARALAISCLVLLAANMVPVRADAYVTPASSHRWMSAAGIRFNDVGGIRFNDAGGIRFNDVGGIRFNDVGGFLVSDTAGIRFNDVGGIRFNDAGGIRFNDAGGGPAIGLTLLNGIATLPDTSAIGVVITYHAAVTAADLDDLRALGVTGGTIFRQLPMVVVNATRDQIAAIAPSPAVRSIWSNRQLGWMTHESLPFTGVAQAEADLAMVTPAGLPFTGQGVSIAFVDTGIDATHPDLPFGTKVVQNVRVNPAPASPVMFLEPTYQEGLLDTDLILGHGTFGAGIAAGTGAASGGYYRGVAPGADLVGLSVGDLYIINVLEAFDYVLDNAAPLGIRVVNCSFATTGPFDPDDPINAATRILHDAGITVVVAAGNHGPAPDTLNPYAVAPWVIGVASGDKAGRLSAFSSRGIFNEGLYRPVLTAPGEGIVSTSSLSLQGVFGVEGVEDPAGGATVAPGLAWAYSAASGTSFAAPHVSGTIALMLQADPGLTPDEIKVILQRSATPMLGRDRSESGAGYLDVWAAMSLTLNPGRAYGSWIPELLDERTHGYQFAPAVPFSGVVPAGGELTIPIDLGSAPLAVQASIAWGPYPSTVDLDVSLRDPAGRELQRSASLNALGLFGLTEGVTAYRPRDAGALAVVSFKVPSAVDQPIDGQYQIVRPVFVAEPDVGSLPDADRHAVLTSLTSLAMAGRNNCFCGSQKLTRGDAARLLALAAQRPQAIPAAPTFNDVSASEPYYPYVESVAGPVSRRGVALGTKVPHVFGFSKEISRLEIARAAVLALDLGSLASSRAGEILGLQDESTMTAIDRGYVAVALDYGILDVRQSASGPVFLPDRPVTRLDGAWAATALLAFRDGRPLGQRAELAEGASGRAWPVDVVQALP